MRTASFIFDGIQGSIQVTQTTVFVQWGTLSCHLSAIKAGKMKGIICRTLLGMNKPKA